MSVADQIQLGVLVVALLALAYQIGNQRKDAKEQEERISNKLKIFFLCQDTPKTEQEIIRHFRNMNIGKKMDEVEVKKSIYEMLKDGTLRYRSNNTFKARRNRAVEDDD
jgi:hypothetical protein